MTQKGANSAPFCIENISHYYAKVNMPASDSILKTKRLHQAEVYLGIIFILAFPFFLNGSRQICNACKLTQVPFPYGTFEGTSQSNSHLAISCKNRRTLSGGFDIYFTIFSKNRWMMAAHWARLAPEPGFRCRPSGSLLP